MKSAPLDTVFELLTFPSSVFHKLIMVVNRLLGNFDSHLLSLLCFSEDLLRRDLHRRGIFVLDLCAPKAAQGQSRLVGGKRSCMMTLSARLLVIWRVQSTTIPWVVDWTFSPY